jgi:ABC-type arginine/histidine transport system permease subunit
MLLLVAVSVVVACSINVNMTLAQTTENHLFGINHSPDVFVMNVYFRGKIRYPFGHIYIDTPGIINEV